MNAEIGKSIEDDSLADRYDVIIVGAGVAGCAAAQALSRADQRNRRSILVVDLHKQVSPRFSGEYIHPRGAEILDDLGFYNRLIAEGAVDVDGFVVMEDAEVDDPVVLDYKSIVGERPQGISVHHKTIVKVMRRTMMEREQVTMRAGWRVTDLIRDELDDERVVGVVIRDPAGRLREARCDLLIAADGKASTVRKLAGIPDRRHTLGFTAGLEVSDAAVAHPLHATVYLGGPGPMLCYPIAREGESMRYRLTFDLPHTLPAKGRALSEYLLDAFVPYLPTELSEQVSAALNGLSRPVEMAPTVNLPAPPATAPGLVLIGDAAGCSHPITASGMTMGLLDAKYLGREARRRADVGAREPWLDDRCMRRFRVEHDRYVPTRQALADSIYEAFRGEGSGARGIRRALFSYWRSGERQRVRSLALLACAERRPQIFLSEYLKTAGHVVHASLAPRHAAHYPVRDRLRQVQGAVGLAGTKVGMVASVAWSQIRPSWMVA
ncbi:FAD-dependent monooxygenase [Pseudenhygromyxa sp. WMMC2535]|uniref:FAD-dependent monooxygenase n=1 Tax=Pseudenhygromyxa sp. WMMC2535 TaxID=2712867 RepID=UPI0015518099|nr:FAD-dependent monooxygenase [Pseudenhygromyxa sp. WMMC2535]NVB40002.1 FAD-dependent monooxygenase [Pseudenhygromyxa sp. WMMC2535]